MYDLLYEFIKTNFFTTTNLSSTMCVWLTNTTTIIVMCLFISVLIKLVVWTFKVVSRGFTRL